MTAARAGPRFWSAGRFGRSPENAHSRLEWFGSGVSLGGGHGRRGRLCGWTLRNVRLRHIGKSCSLDTPFAPISAGLGRPGHEFGRCMPELGRKDPLRPSSAVVCRSRPNLGRLWPNLGPKRPKSHKYVRFWAERVKNSDQNSSSLVECGPAWPIQVILCLTLRATNGRAAPPVPVSEGHGQHRTWCRTNT